MYDIEKARYYDEGDHTEKDGYFYSLDPQSDNYIDEESVMQDCDWHGPYESEIEAAAAAVTSREWSYYYIGSGQAEWPDKTDVLRVYRGIINSDDADWWYRLRDTMEADGWELHDDQPENEAEDIIRLADGTMLGLHHFGAAESQR